MAALEKTGLVLNPYRFFPLWAVVALAAVLMVLAVASYSRTTRPVSARFKRVMLLFRWIAIALLGLCLLRPSLRFTHHDPVRRPLIILLDKSRSMTRISDTPEGLSRWDEAQRVLEENRPYLRDMRRHYDVLTFQFGNGLIGRGRQEVAGDDRFSAYGDALRDAVRQAPRGQIEAVVLLGDGSHNHGRNDPVEVAAELGRRRVPVYTVGVGQDSATADLRDVKVLDVTAPKSAFRFTRIPVRVNLQCRSCQGLEVRVRLEIPQLPDLAPQSETVTVAYSEESVPVEFEVTLERAGEYEFLVTAEPVENELLPQNNSGKAWTKVKETGVHVGYFDVLRPESKFVSRALIGTENMSLDRTLVLEGRALPLQKQDDFGVYDVTILGDLPASAVREDNLSGLVEAVQEEGRGLVVLLTERSGGPRGWAGTALADILPLRLAGTTRVAPDERRFEVARDYAGHPALALADEESESLAAWEDMPALSGAIVGPEVKRAAQILATDQDGNPLLVAHRSGKGLVACLMVDTTFRWTFTESDTQAQHKRFWRQLIMWTSGKEAEAELNVKVSTQHPQLQEKLRISATLRDMNSEPVADARMTFTVREPDGTSVAVPCAYSQEDQAYLADYVAALPGDYQVSAHAERGVVDFGEDTSHFTARDVDVELEHPMADSALLRQIAGATQQVGGRYCHARQAGELFKELKDRAKPVMLTQTRRDDIWDMWPVFALLCGCMVTEWSVRKLKGLI